MGGLLGLLASMGGAPGADFTQRAAANPEGAVGRGQMGWNSGFNKKALFEELLRAISARQQGGAKTAARAGAVPFVRGR